MSGSLEITLVFIGLFALILALLTMIILLFGSLEMLRRLDLRVRSLPRGLAGLGSFRETISHSTGEVIFPEDQLDQAAQAEAEAAMRAEREEEDQRRRSSSRRTAAPLGEASTDDEPPALG
jgi:hypothetical protein